MSIRKYAPIVLLLVFAESQAEVTAWQIDYERSEVRFVATQAGAEFEGHWGKWDAEVRFDPEDLAASTATARFYVSSLQTLDPERDETLQDADWFNEAKHPMVVFDATSFVETPDGDYEAASMLTVKGVSVPLVFRFRVSEQEGGKVLEGDAEIDRIATSLGLGEWADTTWIGQFVRVHVVLHAIF